MAPDFSHKGARAPARRSGVSMGIGLVLLGLAAIFIGCLDYVLFLDADGAMTTGGSRPLGGEGTVSYVIAYVAAGVILVGIGIWKILEAIRSRSKLGS